MYEGGPIQGMLDFESGNANGYENWLREQEAHLDAIRREWSVPLGRRVRIQLRDIDQDFEGKLELFAQPDSIDRGVPLQLRIGRVDFASTDIERCVVLD